MTRWARGQEDIDRLLTDRELQKITSAAMGGAALLEKAARTLATAARNAVDDPESAYVLAYDAARFAGTALLAQQGLRPTARGGHYAVEKALRAQFGERFRAFATLRRRRNELEYPTLPGETTTQAEAEETARPCLARAPRRRAAEGGRRTHRPTGRRDRMCAGGMVRVEDVPESVAGAGRRARRSAAHRRPVLLRAGLHRGPTSW
jgi:hypothetical protein